MKLNKKQKKFLRLLGNRFLALIVRVLCKSVRIKTYGSENLNKVKSNYVLAFWHGTMLLPWYVNRNKNIAAIVSSSSDGELLARALTKWNYRVARGSSHKGGREALDTLINYAEENYSVTITPDGPTGPPKVMKAGAVITAKKTGIPLILLGVYINNKFVLKSWDSFEIPKPFSKAVVVYSEPLYFEKSLTYEETDIKIREAGNLLNDLQLKAKELD
jgi:hypothetical protein